MPKKTGGAAAFEESYELTVNAQFLDSNDKADLATSGESFTVIAVTDGKIDRDAVWRALIHSGKVDGVLTFSKSAGRDEAMQNLQSIIKKHGEIANCALGVFGSNSKGRSASYVIVPRSKWQKPKELPAGDRAGSRSKRRKAA